MSNGGGSDGRPRGQRLPCNAALYLGASGRTWRRCKLTKFAWESLPGLGLGRTARLIGKKISGDASIQGTQESLSMDNPSGGGKLSVGTSFAPKPTT